MKKLCIIIITIFLAQKGFAQTLQNFEWIGGPTYILRLGNFKIFLRKHNTINRPLKLVVFYLTLRCEDITGQPSNDP